jgi:hypothetical protein
VERQKKMEFEADHTECTKLRSDTHNGRYLRTDFGSLNASSNGHPSASGALDQKVLCAFRTRPAPRVWGPAPEGRRVHAEPGH